MHRRVLALLVGITSALAGLAGIPLAEAAHAAGVQAAPLSANSPRGAFDRVSVRWDNQVVISGWAADPDAPQAALTVRFYVQDHYIGAVTTGDKRADVPRANPGFGPSTGWHTTMSALPLAWDFSLGDFVCAYGINTGTGVNTRLGCQHLHGWGGSSPYNPIGVLESAKASPGLIQLSGWAADRDGTRATQVRVYYDGSEMFETTTNIVRPDAPFDANDIAGFNFTLPIAPGPHQICAFAQNSGLAGLENAPLGCVNRTIPGVPMAGPHDPQGHLDGIEVEAIDQNGLFRWIGKGWAFDPDVTGPINVRVRVLGKAPSFPAPNNVISLQNVFGAFRARPDVATMIPAAGPNTGFRGAFLPPQFPELNLLCAYAVNVGPGSSRFLGCFVGHPV